MMRLLLLPVLSAGVRPCGRRFHPVAVSNARSIRRVRYFPTRPVPLSRISGGLSRTDWNVMTSVDDDGGDVNRRRGAFDELVALSATLQLVIVTHSVLP